MTKEKNKLDLVKIKNSCASKDTIKKVGEKKKRRMGENIANHLSDEGLNIDLTVDSSGLAAEHTHPESLRQWTSLTAWVFITEMAASGGLWAMLIEVVMKTPRGKVTGPWS